MWPPSEHPNIQCATEERHISSITRPKFTAAGRLGCALVCFVGAAAMSAQPTTPTIAPYGSWASPLSAEALAAGGINFGDLRSANGHLYWVENVPARGGEVSLFSFGDGATAQVTPNGANVRTRVHEYGGAAFVAVGDTVYYSQLSDQRLYELKPGGTPRPVTPSLVSTSMTERMAKGWCTPTEFKSGGSRKATGVTRMLVMRVALVVCDFVIVVRRA